MLINTYGLTHWVIVAEVGNRPEPAASRATFGP